MKLYRYLSVIIIFTLLHAQIAVSAYAGATSMLSPQSFLSHNLFLKQVEDTLNRDYFLKNGLLDDENLFSKGIKNVLNQATKTPYWLQKGFNNIAKGLLIGAFLMVFNISKVVGQFFQKSYKTDFKTEYYNDGGWQKRGVGFNLFDTTNTNVFFDAGILNADTAFSFIEHSPYLKAQINNKKIKKISNNLSRVRFNNFSLGFAPLNLNNPYNENQTSMPLFATGLNAGYMFDYSTEKVSGVLGASTNLNYYRDVNTGQYFIFDQKEYLFAGIDYKINQNTKVGLRYEGQYLVGPVNALNIDLKLHTQSQNIKLNYLAVAGKSYFMVSPGVSMAIMEQTKGFLELAYGNSRISADVFAKMPLNRATSPTIFDTDVEAGAAINVNVSKTIKVALNGNVIMKNKQDFDKYYVGGKVVFNLGHKNRKRKTVSSSVAYTAHGNVPTEGSTLATYSDSVFINTRNSSNMLLTIGQDSITYTYGVVDFDELTAMQEQYLAELDRQLAEGEIDYTTYRAEMYTFHITGGHVPVPEYQLPETYAEFVEDMQSDYKGDQKVLYIVSALASYMGENNYNDKATESFSEYKKISKLSIDEVYAGIINSRTNPDEDNYVAVCAGIHRLATDILSKCGFEAYNMAFNTEDGVYHMVSMAVVDGVIYFIDYDAITSYGTDNAEYALMLFSNQKHNTVNVSGMYMYEGDNIKHVMTPDSRLIDAALGIETKTLEMVWSSMKTDLNSLRIGSAEKELKNVITDLVNTSTSDSLPQITDYVMAILKDDYRSLKSNFSRRYIFKVIEEVFNDKVITETLLPEKSMLPLIDTISPSTIFYRSA